jgi:hypothetical protein
VGELCRWVLEGLARWMFSRALAMVGYGCQSILETVVYEKSFIHLFYRDWKLGVETAYFE